MIQSSGGAPRATPLFGGALSAVLPRSALDSSALREIPDNQEVFIHTHTDQSLVVELLDYQDQVPDQDAVRFHFDDIARSNGASEPGDLQVTCVASLPRSDLVLTDCSSAWTLTGTQSVSKFTEEARNTVVLHVALLRLPQFSTDLLMSFNDPQNISPASSSAALAGSHSGPWTLLDFKSLVQSLTLHDSGLFV